MKKRLYFSGLHSAKGAIHMGLDEAMLRSPADAPTLRFYTWQPPCISLGRFQKPSEGEWGELDALAKKQGWEMTRRTTGGGAIVHEGELTYSLVLPADDPLTENREELYDKVHRAFLEVVGSDQFRAHGAGESSEPTGGEALMCFMRRASFDLVSNAGGKLLGSAQRRSRGAVLQHGSLKVRKQVVAEGTTSLLELGQNWRFEELALDLAGRVAYMFGRELCTKELDPSTQDRAAIYAQELFSSEDWIRRALRPKTPE